MSLITSKFRIDTNLLINALKKISVDSFAFRVLTLALVEEYITI